MRSALLVRERQRECRRMLWSKEGRSENRVWDTPDSDLIEIAHPNRNPSDAESSQAWKGPVKVRRQERPARLKIAYERNDLRVGDRIRSDLERRPCPVL